MTPDDAKNNITESGIGFAAFRCIFSPVSGALFQKAYDYGLKNYFINPYS